MVAFCRYIESAESQIVAAMKTRKKNMGHTIFGQGKKMVKQLPAPSPKKDFINARSV